MTTADRQGSGAVVAAVMDLHRCGVLRHAVLYDVAEEARGEGNLRDCVADANGKVEVVVVWNVIRMNQAKSGQEGGKEFPLSLCLFMLVV
jgi:hypothetical protein